MPQSIYQQRLLPQPKLAWGALVLFACLIFVINHWTNIDLAIQDFYFDSLHHRFPWKNTWFAEAFMHGHIKKILMIFGVAIILLVVLDFIAPIKTTAPIVRFRLRFIAIVAILDPLITSLIKSRSVYHCPWDVNRYGGSADFLRLFDPIPIGMDAGHCFPAGHATSGLWLAAFCIFWLPQRPKIASLVFAIGLGIGFILGWVQQMRGAHFLTHTLSSMWIVSAIILSMLSISQPIFNRYQLP
ncbi:MAG: phosphatase PAP2 family protein [Methylophilaceae bacterium]|nr:phosphatase PAP2 family protein [Methylophilaceae bacterium]